MDVGIVHGVAIMMELLILQISGMMLLLCEVELKKRKKKGKKKNQKTKKKNKSNKSKRNKKRTTAQPVRRPLPNIARPMAVEQPSKST